LDAQATPAVDAKRVSMLSDVNLRVKIELGRTRMLVEDVLKLSEGSVVELDKLAGDPVDVYANDRLVARGEVLVLDDSFCVRISDVMSRDPHRIIR
jgi:flagellar motor switch protein FliN/FliY